MRELAPIYKKSNLHWTIARKGGEQMQVSVRPSKVRGPQVTYWGVDEMTDEEFFFFWAFASLRYDQKENGYRVVPYGFGKRNLIAEYVELGWLDKDEKGPFITREGMEIVNQVQGYDEYHSKVLEYWQD